MAEKNPDASTADTGSRIPMLPLKNPDALTTYTGEDYVSGIPPLVQEWKEVVDELVSKREKLMEAREAFEQEKREIVEGVLDVIDGMAKEGKKEREKK